MGKQAGFRLSRYEDSIREEAPEQDLAKLNQMEEFRRAYEINEEITETLREAGIKGDFGASGLKPSEWADYGAVSKTLEEFKAAYAKFKAEMVGLVLADNR